MPNDVHQLISQKKCLHQSCIDPQNTKNVIHTKPVGQPMTFKLKAAQKCQFSEAFYENKCTECEPSQFLATAENNAAENNTAGTRNLRHVAYFSVECKFIHF